MTETPAAGRNEGETFARCPGMVAKDRNAWLRQDVRMGVVVPFDLHPVKASPEGYYTWGIFHAKIDWRPLKLQARLSRMVDGAACQTCTLNFPPDVDPALRSRACGCSMPRQDANDRLGCGADLCRGDAHAKRKKVWSKKPPALANQPWQRERAPDHV